MDDYDKRKYRVALMKFISALLGLTFAIQVIVAVSTGHVTLMRTGRREVFLAESPLRFWVNVGVSAVCAVVLIGVCFKRNRSRDDDDI